MTPKQFEDKLRVARTAWSHHFPPKVFDRAMSTGNPWNNPARLDQPELIFLLQCLKVAGLDFPEPKRGPKPRAPKLGQNYRPPQAPQDPGLTPADIGTLTAE